MLTTDATDVVELVPIEAPASTVQVLTESQPKDRFGVEGSARASLNGVGTSPDNVQELAPVDGGWPAWRFVASGFVVEVMVWGFQFRSVRKVTPLLVHSPPTLLQLRYFPRSEHSASIQIYHDGLNSNEDYYTSYPLFKDASGVSISAVGTLSLATQFSEVRCISDQHSTPSDDKQTILLSFFFGRYPDLLRPSLWAALALSVLSLLLASFAKQVRLP